MDQNNTILRRVLAQKPIILKIFHLIFYFIIIAATIVFFISMQQGVMPFIFYDIGVNSGRTALGMLIITLLPGITRRFRIKHQLIDILMSFRRQLGISVYLLALIHFLFVRYIPYLARKPTEMLQFAPFEFFGFIALSLLFFLFLTSNNFSVQKLGKWWKRLHRLVYIIVWLVFIHTSLIGWSIWSITIGVVAMLEVVSLIVDFIYKRSQISKIAQSVNINDTPVPPVV
jgi:methionine sulfoxide reductase heme-binding subunit